MPAQTFSGSRLREIRIARELSREQIAVAIGRSAESLSLYERSRSKPPTVVVERLAKALDCPVAEFFTEGDRP